MGTAWMALSFTIAAVGLPVLALAIGPVPAAFITIGWLVLSGAVAIWQRRKQGREIERREQLKDQWLDSLTPEKEEEYCREISNRAFLPGYREQRKETPLDHAWRRYARAHGITV